MKYILILIQCIFRDKLYLFLDDLRKPTDIHNTNKGIGNKNWIVLRNYNQFKFVVKLFHHKINTISFDHDIASYSNGVEMTGKVAADLIVSRTLTYNYSLPNWYVHSQNTCGSDNIRLLFINYMDKVDGIKIPKTSCGFVDNVIYT